MRESYAFERLRERAVLSLLPICREKKAGLSQLSFFEDEVMALSWPAVSSAFGLAVITCVFVPHDLFQISYDLSKLQF